MIQRFFLLSLMVLSPMIAQDKSREKVQAKEEALSLRLGNSLYNENKIDESLLIFQDFIDLYPESDRRSQVLEKIAEIYEEKQEFVSAQEIYRQLFQELGFSSRGLHYHLEEARLLEVMGNIQGAQRVYRVIIQALPDSGLALKAKRRLQLNRLFADDTPNGTMDTMMGENMPMSDSIKMDDSMKMNDSMEMKDSMKMGDSRKMMKQ